MTQDQKWEDLTPDERRAMLKAEFQAEVERTKALRGAERRDWKSQIRKRKGGFS